ncbi:serine/threonine protein kinase [Coemansia sp. RSA 922]|nr:serine/threonine protein kinase [Coemansia sp. RSA 922]
MPRVVPSLAPEPHSSAHDGDHTTGGEYTAAGQQGLSPDCLEMRERPRIPPKPANLRPPNSNSPTAALAAEGVRALHTTVSDSPAQSLHSTTLALNAAAATPKTPHASLTGASHASRRQMPDEDSGSSRASTPAAQQHAASTLSAASKPPPSSSNHSKQQQSARKRAVDDFDFGNTLGEGSYSTVVEATERASGRVYAAKILDKRHIIKEKKIKYVNIERDILQALHHPFIVRLHYAFQDSQSLYFVIDLAANGELLSWIRKLGGLAEECARFYLAEIILAVEYMHMERTLHRDLKPENILLGSDMHILITDFGTAKMFPKGEADQRANSFVGTAEYVSPELLTEKSADRNSDLWAIGCIAYQLLAGRPPFKGSNEYQTFQKILKLDYAFPPTMPPLACDMVERILVIEPESRLGSTQRGGFKELKAHPFFHGFDWQDVPSRTPPPMAGPNDSASTALRVALPPAIPPKPAVLRQSAVVSLSDGTAALSGIYEQRQSSSDEFGTEKTSDSSFPASPDTPIDPLASFLPPNLGAYQIDAALPVSPRQTPVHIATHRHHHHPPPPPPPPPPPHQQPTLSARSSTASQQMSVRPIAPSYHQPTYSQITSQSTDNDIYNVRLYDHVPAPLRAEEMAAVQNHHRNTTRQQHQMGAMSTTADYYNAASYRPPGQPMHSVYTNNNYGAGHSASGNGTSWSAKLKSIVCCGSQ